MHNVNSCWFQVCLGGTRKLAKVGNFLKMDRVEYRAVIRFLLLEGENATNIHKRLSNVYGKSSPSYSTVASWVSEFKRGRKDLNDEPRPGRPVSQSPAENVDKVHQLVLENRKISIECIVQETGLSTGTVHTILHEHLSMSKVCARWVPKMLTPDMKATRVNTSSVLLSRYNVNPENFLSRVVTGDETWVYYYDPPSKFESMEWKHAGSPRTKKFKVSRTTKKVMATVFWDTDGVIHIDYLPRGTTMNGQYYADLLVRLRESIKEKRRGKIRRGVLLQQDNAPVHSSKVAMQSVRDCGFELLPHPPYSPDLAPSDFFLFSKLKKELRGQRYDDDDELMLAVEGFCKGHDSAFYREGLEALPRRWTKCIESQGDYVE